MSILCLFVFRYSIGYVDRKNATLTAKMWRIDTFLPHAPRVNLMFAEGVFVLGDGWFCNSKNVHHHRPLYQVSILRTTH